jgi:biotin synthase-related radical SAM superfamily protein
MVRHIHVKVGLPDDDKKQAEATKIARLRSLRLEREAADQERARREILLSALALGVGAVNT